jgi:hypothetical protein
MAALTGNLEDLAQGLGTKVLDQVKEDFGSAWDGVKDIVKDTLSDVARDAGRLAVKKMQGEDVSEEEKHIHAQLLNLKVAGEIIAVRTFWESFGKVMGVIGTGLGAIAKAGLKALTGGII